MTTTTRPQGSLACLLLALALAGCGGGGKKDAYPVRGKVVVGGKPAERVVVTLHPVGTTGSRRSMATTEADGTFQVSTAAKYDGAPPGQYAVTLVWPEYTPAGEPGPDRLKGRYAKPAKPFTTVTVPAAETDLPPFEVTP